MIVLNTIPTFRINNNNNNTGKAFILRLLVTKVSEPFTHSWVHSNESNCWTLCPVVKSNIHTHLSYILFGIDGMGKGGKECTLMSCHAIMPLLEDRINPNGPLVEQKI